MKIEKLREVVEANKRGEYFEKFDRIDFERIQSKHFEALLDVVACAKHAQELGYLGDGSIAGWMKDCLDKLENIGSEE